MTPVEPGRYVYKPSCIVEIRKKLDLSQQKMANLIGVETNTLSRWETGSTTPDATMLAKIYSVATDLGIKPVFFKMIKPKGRHRLIVMWDFEDITVSRYRAEEADEWITDTLQNKFSSTTSQLFKAFSNPIHASATDALVDNDWRVWEEDEDVGDEIYDHAYSDCGQDPTGTIFVLIAKNSVYTNLIQELKSMGVRVYLIAPQYGSEELVRQVGAKRWIQWPGNLY